MTPTPNRLSEGWGWPLAAKKAHYYKEGDAVSLCGRWAYSGPRTNEVKSSPDDCKDCTRRVVALEKSREPTRAQLLDKELKTKPPGRASWKKSPGKTLGD